MDITTAPAERSVERSVERRIEAPRMLEGAGFEVRRPFPTTSLEAVGPFILLDQFGPVEFAPGAAIGAPTHPHAGIETLTYLLEGSGHHLDSLGNEAITGPGEVQWMRAGRGIIHDEGPDEVLLNQGGRSHGVQLWLNMPDERKNAEPAYRTFAASDLPALQSSAGLTIRVIAGKLAGQSGPLETFASPLLAHVQLAADTAATLELDSGSASESEIGAYVLAGSVRFGPEGAQASEGNLVLFSSPGTSIRAVAESESADFLILGGPPLKDRLFRYGPFVANSEADMHRVFRDYQSGKFGSL